GHSLDSSGEGQIAPSGSLSRLQDCLQTVLLRKHQTETRLAARRSPLAVLPFVQFAAPRLHHAREVDNARIRALRALASQRLQIRPVCRQLEPRRSRTIEASPS